MGAELYDDLARSEVAASVGDLSPGAPDERRELHLPAEHEVGPLEQGPNELEFNYPITGQPKKFKPGSTDERNLAVRFFLVQISPDD